MACQSTWHRKEALSTDVCKRLRVCVSEHMFFVSGQECVYECLFVPQCLYECVYSCLCVSECQYECVYVQNAFMLVCVCFRSVPKGTVFYFPIKDKAGTVYCLKGADGKDFVLATRINQSSLHFLTRNAGIGQVSACALPVLFSAQLQLNLSIRARFGRNRETNEIKQPSWQLKFAHPTLFLDKCLRGTNIYWALFLVKNASLPRCTSTESYI